MDGGAVVKDVLGALAPFSSFVMFALMAIGFRWPFSASCTLSVLDGGYIQLGRQCAGGLAARRSMWAATHLGAERGKGSRVVPMVISF